MNIIAALIGVIILYKLIEGYYIKHWDKNLEIRMNFSKNEAFVGEKLQLQQTITNKKLLPLPLLILKFTTSKYLEFSDTSYSTVSDNYYRSELMTVLMYQKLQRNLDFTCTRRGEYSIKNVDLISYNFFMSDKSVIKMSSDINLIVYPKIINTDQFEIAFKSLLGEVITKRQLIEDPFEFKGVRDYQIFDSMKSINWTASARSLGLKVNINNFTASQRIKIIFNLDTDLVSKQDVIEETCISLAASFANAFIEAGIQTSCYCNGKNRITKELFAISPGCGSQHLKYILFSLARIDLEQKLDNFNNLLQELLKNDSDNDWIVLISPSKDRLLQETIFNNITDTQSFVWISPCFKDTIEKPQNNIINNIIPWYVDNI